MVINSVDFGKQVNNDVFTVSCPANQLCTNKYWAQGIIQITVSTLSASYPIVIKDFPYDFKIISASFNTMGFGKASHGVSLYHTATNATGLICEFTTLASRAFIDNTTLNFNKVNVSTTHSLKLKSYGASANKIAGVLTLDVRPI